MSDAIQPPVATGNLAKTPFVHLVLYLYQHRGSGTLIVRTKSGEHRVLFHRGRAVAARVPQPAAAIDQALMPLSAMVLGDFEFHEADLVGSGPSVLTGMFDPYVFVAEAARKHARPEIVAGLLSKYVAVPLRLESGTDLSRLGLTPEEQRFVQPLTRGAMTIEALLALEELPADAARRILYTLLITRSVGPEGAGRDSQRTVAGNSPRVSQPSVSTSAAPTGQRPSDPDAMRRPSRPLSERLRPSGDAWRAIASRAGEIAENRRPSEPRPATTVRTTPRPPQQRTPSQSSPRAVELPLSQPPERRTDSRSVRRPGSAPISEPLAGGGGQRSDSRPLTPSPYRESMTSGVPRVTPSAPLGRVTPRPSLPDVSTLDSAGKFRRVELLCQRNSFDDALPIMRGLIEEDRKSAKYLGMLANVLFGRTTTEESISKEIVEAVNQALRIDPDQVHALYTKARCYKRVNKEREALHYFRRTVAVDPSHLDAAREVRLLISRLNDKRKR
jgi:hypothetical protein